MSEQKPLGLGLVGAGGFGRFCLRAYSKLPGLRLVAVCDNNRERLSGVAEEFGMRPYTDLSSMLADSAVDIVAVNTPPSNHAAIVVAVAQAGKHVFCEKPLATDLASAESALRAVRQAGVVLSLDYVMRHNPLYRLLERFTALKGESGPLLGELKRFSIENFAADENLGPDHWFWDESVSGGIFVEHGVHFFDLAGWHIARLPRRVVALATERKSEHPAGDEADKGNRTRSDIDTGTVSDTVQAVVEYDGGATGSFYHSFTRANAAEHQGITYGWGWATAQLRGWIALNLALDAWVDEQGLAALLEIAEDSEALRIPGEVLLPRASLKVQILESFPADRIMQGHGDRRRITKHVRVVAELGGEDAKPRVYEQSVRAGMADVLNSISASAPPCVSAADVWWSTATAIAAREAAVTHREVLVSSVPAGI